MLQNNATKMWWLSVVGVLLLCPVSTAQCLDDVPKKCTFDDGFCGWDNFNWTTTENNIALLVSGNASGKIASKARCVTSSSSHCFKFKFKLTEDNRNSLNVSISWPPNDGETLLWSYSKKTDTFRDAKVPVHSDSTFTLIISARLPNAYNNRRVQLKKFQYETSSCDIKPFSATPPTAATPTTTATTTTTETKSDVKTTPRTLTTDQTSDTTNNAFPSSGATDDVTSTSKTGTIIGVVVALLVAVVVVVVLTLIVRGKRIPLLAILSAKKNNHPDDSGYRNAAFDPGVENATTLNATGEDEPYANCQNRPTSRVDSGLSNDEYIIITDVERDGFTSSGCQPITSLYAKAQGIHTYTGEVKQEATDIERKSANPYDIIDEGLEIGQSRTSLKEVEYKNLAIEDIHQIGKHANSKDSSETNTRQTGSNSVYCLAQPAQAEESVYQNMKDGSVGFPSSLNSMDKNTGKTGRGRKEDYNNVEKHPAANHDPDKASRVGNILEEDQKNHMQPASTGDVYHVLEPETKAAQPHGQPAGIYRILEEIGTHNQSADHVSSQEFPNEAYSLAAKGDYHSLDFQKLRAGDVAVDSGDEMGQTYSHLNEAREDTYDELSREKKRKVVDGNYSLVKLD